MDGQFAGIISFFIYLFFFGWLGLRRGVTREIIVFATALVGWLVTSERGYIVVNVANIGAASLEFAKAGGFNGSTEEAFTALTNAPLLVTDETQSSFLYLVWVGGVLLMYLLTNMMIPDKRSKSNVWSMLIGMLNGLFFALIFLPGLSTLFSSGASEMEAQGSMDLMGMIETGGLLLFDAFSSIWKAITPLGPNGILILGTCVLVLVAISISGGSRAKTPDR